MLCIDLKNYKNLCSKNILFGAVREAFIKKKFNICYTKV